MSRFKRITIDNSRPRCDTDGHILDAHGGPLFNRFGERYYNYGVHYMDTDGFSTRQHYVSYSSPDLEHWTFHGPLFDGHQPEGLYFRPHVLYDPKACQYVMWFLYYDHYEHDAPNQCIKGVATAKSPTGPFSIHALDVPLSAGLSGDHDLFLDDDGTAYLIYSAHYFDRTPKEAVITVERLSEDFLSSTMESVQIDAEGVPCEAPALFKRDGIYYAVFDHWTDRGPEGSGARVNTAPAPLGPYTYRGNINRYDEHCIILPAQQNTIAPVMTPDGPLFIWAGDRWRSDTVRSDRKIMGNAFQYWYPLTFNEDGSIQKLGFLSSWELEVEVFD